MACLSVQILILNLEVNDSQKTSITTHHLLSITPVGKTQKKTVPEEI